MTEPLVSTYSEDLPRKKYQEKIFRTLPCLKWGQRKLLLTEIDFLNRCYRFYRQNEKKYLLYVGASPGYHINYLMIMFPDIHFILYDKVKSEVDLKNPNVVFHQKYFDDEEAKKYIGMNLFYVCDIRNLEIGKHHSKMREIDGSDKNDEGEKKYHEKKSFDMIDDDMTMQRRWAEIMKPIKSHLKFRLTWEETKTEYYDGEIFWQPWTGNGSLELRIIPILGSTKFYDNKIAEEVAFYYNTVTRRKKVKTKNPCIMPYHEAALEEIILQEYLEQFQQDLLKTMTMNDAICNMVISISYFLSRNGTRKSMYNISELFLKRLSDKKVQVFPWKCQ